MAHWNAVFPMKDLIEGDEDATPEEAKAIGVQVANRLRERFSIFGVTRTNRFAERFENVNSQDEFNNVLNDLYDVADNIRVWIE